MPGVNCYLYRDGYKHIDPNTYQHANPDTGKGHNHIDNGCNDYLDADQDPDPYANIPAFQTPTSDVLGKQNIE